MVGLTILGKIPNRKHVAAFFDEQGLEVMDLTSIRLVGGDGRASYVVVTIRLHVVQADMGRSPTDLLRDHGIRTAKAAATYVPNPAVLFS